MLRTLKNIWHSLFFKRDRIVPGLVCFGTANEFMDPTEVPGYLNDRSKFGSFKLVVSHLKGDVVYFYCYLVNSDGFEHISGTIRKTNVKELARRIRNLSLVVER